MSATFMLILVGVFTVVLLSQIFTLKGFLKDIKSGKNK